MADDKPISLDNLNPLDLEGTPENIALVERGLAIMTRKQIVWKGVLDAWKRELGLAGATLTATMSSTPVSPGREIGFIANIATLIQAYQIDDRSPIHKLQFKSRENYDGLMRRIERTMGHIELSQCKAEHIVAAHEEWVKGGKFAMAHALITRLRGLFSFGATSLGDRECERIAGILHNLRFPVARVRSARMSTEHALAIIKLAQSRGLRSIALAQAIQFEVGLKQKEVIGEWVPSEESGESDIKFSDMKWVRGLRWGDLDPSRLKDCPWTQAIIETVPVNDRVGPMIRYEKTKLPFHSHQWRTKWREIADEVGVPKQLSRGRMSGANGPAHQDAPEDSDLDDQLVQEARH